MPIPFHNPLHHSSQGSNVLLMVDGERIFAFELYKRLPPLLCAVLFICGCGGQNRLVTGVGVIEGAEDLAADELEMIRVSEDGTGFIHALSGSEFVIWGFNYDHDRTGRLIEDYWDEEWATVVVDFREIKALGANVVRIHLQVGKFMDSPRKPNQAALRRLARLVALAEETALYLDITGLGCYEKEAVPNWYDVLSEEERWDVQALFWEAVAGTCAGSPAVFCYDIMNEPVLPGAGETFTEWLTGEFGGKHFVQRIALDLAGRTREQVAKAWVDKLTGAIRKHDDKNMITVGVIPWAHVFPNAAPIFYSAEVGEGLDFVSIHLYPKKGEVKEALDALDVYRLGKPLLIEETSPLWCGEEEFDKFIDGSRKKVSGYLGFYWGQTIEEYLGPDLDIAGGIMKAWLEYFRAKAPEIGAPQR